MRVPTCLCAAAQPHLALQVRVFREHGGEVTDLCFDDSTEYLTSAAADGSVAVRDCIASATAVGGVAGTR